MISVERPVGLLSLLVGFTIWSAAFLILYSMHALGCLWGWHQVTAGPTSLLRIVLVGIWIGHVAILAVVTLATRRYVAGAGSESGFIGAVAYTLLLAGLAATLFNGIPAAWIPLCVPP
ncbi:hypothetical protein [Salinarimonas sp.]|uniref:hypothetical protein n=1 Tax=Salinarimonas sp. TaxID=2766526 RepID=UPI00391C26F7